MNAKAKLELAREALEGAARSLEAAGNAGREDSLIADLETLRPWAKARARLVREALVKLGASATGKCACYVAPQHHDSPRDGVDADGRCRKCGREL